jgi:hypothetical protein
MRSPGNHNGVLLLEALPMMLGFEPRESLVVVGLTARQRTGMVMRVDRDDCLLPEVVRELGRSIAVHLSRAGYAQAVVVSYGSPSLEQPDAAVEALLDSLGDTIAVRDAWLVSGGRFRSQWCTDFACCPRRGAPVRASGTVGLDAATTAMGAKDPAARRRAMRARERALVARARKGPAWECETYSLWRDAVDEALDGRMPGDAMSGRLLAGLDSLAVRDAIIVDLDGRGEGVCAEAVVLADGRVRDSLWGLVEGRPARDSARVEAAVDLALHLASIAAGARVRANAAPLTIAAIGQWWLGDTSAAQHLADAALAAEPGYRLAQLVSAAMLAGLRP